MPKLKISPKSQSLIEYTTIAALVMLGILVMGPYVVRSINAYFHQMDVEVKESLQEQIGQAPVQNLGLPGCVCTPLQPDGCGIAPCLMTEMHRARSCGNPVCVAEMLAKGSAVAMEDCLVDATCCTDWLETNLCGQQANPAAGLGGQIPGGCPDGEMEFSRKCGDPTSPTKEVTQYACQSACAGPDPLDCPIAPYPICNFQCDALVVDPNARTGGVPNWCPGLTSGLSQPLVEPVYVLDCTTATEKCSVKCNDPYILDPSGTGCMECPYAAQCGCPVGMVERAGCAAGYATNICP